MADLVDVANDRIDAELEAAIAALASPADVSESAIWCGECDNEIPEARRLAVPGCQLCVHCQTISERKGG